MNVEDRQLIRAWSDYWYDYDPAKTAVKVVNSAVAVLVQLSFTAGWEARGKAEQDSREAAC